MYITASGKHKGKLTEKDFILIRFFEVDKFEVLSASDGAKPSYETPLHISMYLVNKNIKSILHVHSPNSVAISHFFPDGLSLSGLEIIKAFGLSSHEDNIHIPVFDNSQDMLELSRQIMSHFVSMSSPGFLLRGHGVYSFGIDVNDAYIKLEAMEHIFEIILRLRIFQDLQDKKFGKKKFFILGLKDEKEEVYSR